MLEAIGKNYRGCYAFFFCMNVLLAAILLQPMHAGVRNVDWL